MTRLHHSPWDLDTRDVEGFRQEIDRLINNFSRARSRTAGVYPPLNVSETPDALVVRAELPGVEISDLDVSI